MTFTPDVEPEAPAGPRGSAVPMVGVAVAATAVMIGSSVAHMRYYPEQPLNPAFVLGIVACMAGHGLFVAADRVRRGRPGRGWGIASAACPMFVLWLYFAAEYRLHAFWQIPVSIFYYLVVLGWVPAVIGAG